MSYAKVLLLGNLGSDPELRYTADGAPVCSFSIATNDRRRDPRGTGFVEVTTWWRVTLWGKLAETASAHLKKGRPVYVEGRVRLEEWTNRENKVVPTLEVHGTEMQFVGNNNQ